ncbi:Maltose/maltodextrin ABC transporter, permease protein MalF [plant metagenome]|uniref:Maltose/maltodextrin ABC transporter, permease protein MalF n=2 Tax=root TaxID=1 RepID=A0A1C3K761_9BURK|nr:sugar ABC transporter permease [Orrella dioscoreae]SBT27187.1 Maltose/maltodextrin ABC transporter, permease protein MalF [Orrella dioscoreae]SOE46067.1 Maltose/maltodextrin ABC transporter, permease protein MalF [Orrella dioscoreae]
MNRVHSPWFPYALIAPALLVLVVVSLVPFCFAVFLSLHKINFGQIGAFAGFDNYLRLFNDARFWNSLAVAAKFVLIAVPLEFGLGLAGALILNKRVWGRSVLLPLLFIPTMMAPILVGLLWKVMFAGSWGLLSYNVLERFGWLAGTSVFSSTDYALLALALVDVWQWTPFMILAFFAGLQALPVSPYRAAAVDGATPMQMFLRLTLPLMAPLLAVIGMLRFIDAFKVFDSIFILTAGGPGIATESPSMLAYKMSFEQWRLGESAAFAVLVWISFFLLCNVFYHVARKKLNAF